MICLTTRINDVLANSPLLPLSPSAGYTPPLAAPAVKLNHCNVSPGTDLPEHCIKGGSLSVQLTYGEALALVEPASDLPAPPAETLAQSFHIIVFWTPANEGSYPEAVTTG